MLAIRSSLLAGIGMAALLLSAPVLAQDNAAANADAAQRIDRLERQLRAVQSRVFPGGQQDPLFRPQGNADQTPAPPSSPTGGVDQSARLDAIEAQLARLTGDIEQTGFRQRQLEAEIARLRTDYGARLTRLEPATPTEAATSAPDTATPAASTPRPATATPAPAPAPTPAPRATTSPRTTTTATTPDSAARRARVAALEQPATGDPAEDAYLFGYRLWNAGLYPEAQAQLQRVIEQFPNHRRASHAANLLGRAYLDNNQPTLAVRAFYDNYRTRPRGERAADSVYYMGMALIRLDRLTDACRTFEEFDRSYGSSASAALKRNVAAGRTQARCSAATPPAR